MILTSGVWRQTQQNDKGHVIFNLLAGLTSKTTVEDAHAIMDPTTIADSMATTSTTSAGGATITADPIATILTTYHLYYDSGLGQLLHEFRFVRRVRTRSRRR